MNTQFSLKRLAFALLFLLLVTAALIAWNYRDYVRSPRELYEEARRAEPNRAVELYTRLAEKQPALKDYALLWQAEARMPDLEAMRDLQAITDFEPESPLAYEARIARARYYASIQAPQAADEYRTALKLNDTAALRLELARYLEQVGDNKDAYLEYRDLLSKEPDAFEGMRRTGTDPLAVAKDLIAATYYSDALETLVGSDDPKAVGLRAQALAGLGRYDEAKTAYQSWLQTNPDDTAARLGLAQTLANLNAAKDALALYQQVKTPASQLAQADLLEENDPKQALALYLDSPYPVAWWSATGILEAQKRLTETLPLYARVAQSDSAFADDAAFRLYVLGKRLGDQKAQAQAKSLLDGFGLDWLAIQTGEEQFTLPLAPPISASRGDILERASALDSIGCQDTARLELVLAARSRQAPEVDLAMAEGLAARGSVRDAQSIAEKYIKDHDHAPLAFWQLSYPQAYSDTVNSVAAEFNVDPLLIWAVMREESRFDPEAISYAGARGLMQITSATQADISKQLGQSFSPGDAFVPQSNIRMGAWYLHFLLSYYKGNAELAIMAYNGGAASVDSWQKDSRVSNRDDLLRWIGFGETREYLEKVSLSYRIYQELYSARGKGK